MLTMHELLTTQPVRRRTGRSGALLHHGEVRARVVARAAVGVLSVCALTSTGTIAASTTATAAVHSDFASWAAAPGVKVVAGDFNGDGRDDLALTGGAGWNTVPVAFSQGNGTFAVTNQSVASIPVWSAQTNVKVVAGDLNGDGRDDLALTGGAGWNTVPVAFSQGNGTFAVTNQSVASIPVWSAQTNVKVVAGDLNGDGRDDLALTGGAGWNTVPVAFSQGNGTFAVTNQSVASIPVWSAQTNVKVVAGDLNGDGRDDLALTGGAGWNTVPVAFSQGNGTFAVTNQSVASIPVWAAQTNVKVVAGDLNGDGRDDLALTGGAGWNTVPVAFSQGNGTFAVTNQSVASIPVWSAQTNVKVVAGDLNGDGRDDLALTGGAGWNTVPVAFSRGNGTFTVTNW